ncbi:MAG: Stp1/IreP family PP2C-type Ser/Thr phosphatase [Desulfomonilaceae bacterium]
MLPKKHRVRVGYLSDTGLKRHLNEDSLYVDEHIGLFLVADGMGGHNAGEVASSIAVEVISSLVEDGLNSGEDHIALIRHAILKANYAILEKSRTNVAWSGMGTTILVAMFGDDNLLLAHVGDSRAYSVGNRHIRQLTEDHTFVAEWLRQGLINRQQARTHHQRHGLTQALGVSLELDPDIQTLPWEYKQCLLLCSDGLTEMIEDEEILAITNSSANPQQACVKLVSAANQKGGVDNITVILVCPDKQTEI